MWYAFDQYPAVGCDGCDLAASNGLVDGEKRIGIMADWEDLGYASILLADEGRRLVAGVLGEKAGELAVGAEGGLDGDDCVGGEVGDAGDCWSISIGCARAEVCGINVPASPAVRTLAMVAAVNECMLYRLIKTMKQLLSHSHGHRET